MWWFIIDLWAIFDLGHSMGCDWTSLESARTKAVVPPLEVHGNRSRGSFWRDWRRTRA
jgi:hypothetical protein